MRTRPTRSRVRGSVDLLTRARLARPGLSSTSSTAVRPVLDHGRPDHRLLGAGADQRGVGGDPVRGQPGQVVDRLDQVGLALPVAADERRDARLERDVGGGVGPEVVEGQVGDVHGASLRRGSVGADVAAGGRLGADRVAAELVAHRGDRLHRRAVVLARGEPGEQRGRDDVHRHGVVDRGLDGPAALAGVLGVAARSCRGARPPRAPRPAGRAARSGSRCRPRQESKTSATLSTTSTASSSSQPSA